MDSFLCGRNEVSAPMGMVEAKLSMTDRLEREITQLSGRLTELNKVLATLKANPQVQEVIDVLTKMHVY